MMKKIIFIGWMLAMMMSVNAQIKQSMPAYGYWFKKRVAVDSAFQLPRVAIGVKDYYAGYDTAQVYYDPSDSTLKIYTGSQWIGVTGGGASIDTSNKWVNNIIRIPGIDSFYFNVGGTWYAVKDSVGSGTVSSVGLTMPSAFNVSSSPVTGSGTIGVTGAGTTNQYIRGDGTLGSSLPSALIPSWYSVLGTSQTWAGNRTQDMNDWGFTLNNVGEFTWNINASSPGAGLFVDGNGAGVFDIQALKYFGVIVDNGVGAQMRQRMDYSPDSTVLWEISSTGAVNTEKGEMGIYMNHKGYGDTLHQLVIHSGGLPNQNSRSGSLAKGAEVWLTPNLLRLNTGRVAKFVIDTLPTITNTTGYKVLFRKDSDSSVAKGDVSLLGGSQNLQDVTDVGNTSTNDIIHDSGGGGYSKIGDDAGTPLIEVYDPGLGVFNALSDRLGFSDGATSKSIVTGGFNEGAGRNYTDSLPDSSGVFVLRVKANGNWYNSDTAGTVDLGTLGGSGTVTSFTFTDGNGFDGTVTNSTTTPTLSLTTTVTDDQVMVSNSGAISGSSGLTFDGNDLSIVTNNSSTTYNGLIVNNSYSGSGVSAIRFQLNSSAVGSFFASNLSAAAYGIISGMNFRNDNGGDIGFTTGTLGSMDGADLLIKASGDVIVQNNNLGVKTTSFGSSAIGVIAIGNGTAPGSSITDGVQLFAQDVSSSSELKVRDEAGNTTTLSPHNFTGIPEGRSEQMAWSFYSEKDGKYINVDMLKLARLIEQMTGEKLVYTGDINNKPNKDNK
jgi:hypothetical protein